MHGADCVLRGEGMRGAGRHAEQYDAVRERQYCKERKERDCAEYQWAEGYWDDDRGRYCRGQDEKILEELFNADKVKASKEASLEDKSLFTIKDIVDVSFWNTGFSNYFFVIVSMHMSSWLIHG